MTETLMQIEHLLAAGCERIFKEKESGAKQNRPELKALLGFVRDGDTVVVAKLDRMAETPPVC